MKPGVRLIEEKVGTGPVAERPMTVLVRMKMMLNRGEVILPTMSEQVVDLGTRETIAGLRYGIEGMRVGGWRKIQVSPHLAYGSTGQPEMIPPESALRFEIELLEIHEPGWRLPVERDVPVLVASKGEDVAARLPYWYFWLDELGGGQGVVTWPAPTAGGKPQSRVFQFRMEPEEAAGIFHEVLRLEAEGGPAVLRVEQVEFQEGGLYRGKESGRPCVNFGIVQGQKSQVSYWMEEDSEALIGLATWQVVEKWILPRLAAEGSPLQVTPEI